MGAGSVSKASMDRTKKMLRESTKAPRDMKLPRKPGAGARRQRRGM